MFDMTDVIDLHVHTAPDTFPRLGDDLAIARACAAAGMAGMAVKCHYEGTAARAHLVNQQVPGFTMFGGITLNYPVGGINPAAVHSCLAIGGRVVWMPSGHAHYHSEVTGTLGGWGNSFMQLYNPPDATGLTVLDGDGRLTDAAREVVRLVAAADALLATSHLSPHEILAVLDDAADVGTRVLVNHVMYMPQCDLDFIAEIVRRGGYVEICSVLVSGFWDKLRLDDVQAVIDRVGAGRVVLASDGGGIQTPMPHESLRVLADNLLHRGVPESELRRMLVDNPRHLLGLSGRQSTPQSKEDA
ncbi:hypothetical protein Pme01_43420 [Planosporangium mesophilum]|uniref:Cytosolic protein n=2 Tax=Planosporangium mesophilum TaxID=689768 RepID=A0A8J3TCQ1_9ACTN|nr:hypothetical protein [Planosporangium mesophilum]GII24745.1 hypothetical protein Pme01_43420 [Planosporangium mesophilum]